MAEESVKGSTVDHAHLGSLSLICQLFGMEIIAVQQSIDLAYNVDLDDQTISPGRRGVGDRLQLGQACLLSGSEENNDKNHLDAL